MKKTIWKFCLKTTDLQSVKMPKGAEILHVNSQFNNLKIWALVDPEQEREERFFEIFGTGHTVDMDADRKYLGTYQLHEGSLVFHVFERFDVL